MIDAFLHAIGLCGEGHISLLNIGATTGGILALIITYIKVFKLNIKSFFRRIFDA